MAAAHISSSFSFPVQLQRHLVSPVATDSGRRGVRPNGLFCPSPARCPGTRPVPHALSSNFDVQEGLTSVQALLHQHLKSSRAMMTTVDHLKRLCLDHYFHDEIKIIVDSYVDHIDSDDLLDGTLSLRLMREAGYQIPADKVLQKFANCNGDFKYAHSKDIRGLMSLHDMSHLNMGEASLYKAKEFSGKHLTSAIKHLEPNLARYVRRSLDHPYHISLTQYKARHHMSYLQSLSTTNTAIEKLALAEFKLNKLFHQMEMQEVKRWWMDLGLAQEIPAARDQIMKRYMWPMTVLPGLCFSTYRIEITRIISFIYIIDDIFDLVTTQEELSLLNDSIKM